MDLGLGMRLTLEGVIGPGLGNEASVGGCVQGLPPEFNYTYYLFIATELIDSRFTMSYPSSEDDSSACRCCYCWWCLQYCCPMERKAEKYPHVKYKSPQQATAITGMPEIQQVWPSLKK